MQNSYIEDFKNRYPKSAKYSDAIVNDYTDIIDYGVDTYMIRSLAKLLPISYEMGSLDTYDYPYGEDAYWNICKQINKLIRNDFGQHTLGYYLAWKDDPCRCKFHKCFEKGHCICDECDCEEEECDCEEDCENIYGYYIYVGEDDDDLKDNVKSKFWYDIVGKLDFYYYGEHTHYYSYKNQLYYYEKMQLVDGKIKGGRYHRITTPKYDKTVFEDGLIILMADNSIIKKIRII